MNSKSTHKKLGALLLCVLLSIGGVQAQSMRTLDEGRGDLTGIGDLQQNPQIGQNPFEDPDAETEEGEKPKKERVRKPNESWFFSDSVKASPSNFVWNVDMFTNNVHMDVIDTLLTNFQVDYPFLKEGIGDAYQGNLGGASIPLDYHRRPKFQDFSFVAPYYSYLYTPENAPHYNVKKPYTRLEFLTAGQKQFAEENFSLIHAQNAMPGLGFNLTYHTMGTRGIYINQRTKDTDFTAGISYTGKRYSGHAGYIFNTLDIRDHGGVIDDRHITEAFAERPRGIPMWLSASTSNSDGARTIMKNSTFYTVHSYGIPLRRITEDDFSIANVPAIFVGYAFQYDRWTRKYTDQYIYTAPANNPGFNPSSPPLFYEPDANGDFEQYYDNWYINNDYTRDSLSETKLTNRVFVQLQPWDRDGIVGTIDAGVGVDIHNYHMFQPNDYLAGSKGKDQKTSFYVYGAVDGKFRKYFDWDANIKFVPAGYKLGDIDAGANAKFNIFFGKMPVSISGAINYSRSEPAYWSQNWYSNHYQWSNSFKKENETRIEAKLNIPAINMDVEFYQTILTNKIYYANQTKYKRDIIPMQSNDIVSVTGVYLRKDFSFGGFNMNNRVLLQWTDKPEIVPVPLASIYLSWFYEFNIVKNVLRAKIGLDGRYNTQYYAMGFNPAIGQFYNQQDYKYGKYPWVDVFATFKWKRLRIYLKVEHLTQNWFNTREYFMIAHYPMNKRIFKLGLSWSWYD